MNDLTVALDTVDRRRHMLSRNYKGLGSPLAVHTARNFIFLELFLRNILDSTNFRHEIGTLVQRGILNVVLSFSSRNKKKHILKGDVLYEFLDFRNRWQTVRICTVF